MFITPKELRVDSVKMKSRRLILSSGGQPTPSIENKLINYLIPNYNRPTSKPVSISPQEKVQAVFISGIAKDLDEDISCLNAWTQITELELFKEYETRNTKRHILEKKIRQLFEKAKSIEFRKLRIEKAREYNLANVALQKQNGEAIRLARIEKKKNL